ncbi:MAG TPA: phytoene desaturase [Polyangiales bacterium]|nr:phytoene desaturase [Polyangiales bacterium]
MSKRERRAAVIGSGFGGLAVAIRLQTAGFKTTIFEALEQPGGRATVFRENGFVFDAGPTVITAPHCLEELFSEAGRRMSDYVELMPVAPFYRLLWSDGDTFDYTGDAADMLRAVSARSPEDVEGYRRFVAYAKQVFEKGYEELAATPFLRFSDMLRVAPQLARLRADRSVYSTVSRFVKDEHLRQALSFHTLLVGGNPFETSSIYTLIHYLERKWGVFFPRGGTGSLVQALVRLFEELGGTLELSTPVERVRVLRNGKTVHRVRAGGQERDFDLVVSNADLHHTYSRLFPEEPSAQRESRRVAALDWSMSLFVLYFGTDRTYREQLAHHTVLFGPRYRELLKEIFHGHELPEDFSLYLHAPTVTDASLAPPGCDSFYVLSPVPHLGQAALNWRELAPRYADRILGALEVVMPNLREHVVVRRYRTPEDFRDQLGAFQGSAFSCAPKLTQSAWFRPHNRDPHIPGLYLVGAGTHPGAGVPGVVNSAKATASLILEDFV